MDVDENPDISSQLKIEGLPTVIFIPKEAERTALRTEGLIPAAQVIGIVQEMSMPEKAAS